MNSGEQLFLAFKSYGQAFRILDKYKLWSILIFPALLSLAIAILIAVLAWATSGDIVIYITRKYSFKDYDSKIGNLIEMMISFLIRGITLFMYLKIYRYLVLVVLSPIFVNISSLLHRKVDGSTEKPDLWTYCFCSFRGIKLAIRNFIFEILLTFVLLFLAVLVIWIFPIIPALIFIIESYFYGMVMMDYRLEMDGISLKDSIQKIRENAGLATGNGILFNLIILFPVFGVIIGPTIALVAAKTAIDEQQKSKFYVNPIHKPIQ